MINANHKLTLRIKIDETKAMITYLSRPTPSGSIASSMAAEAKKELAKMVKVYRRIK